MSKMSKLFQTIKINENVKDFENVQTAVCEKYRKYFKFISNCGNRRNV